jgi:hypothetical protein
LSFDDSTLCHFPETFAAFIHLLSTSLKALCPTTRLFNQGVVVGP